MPEFIKIPSLIIYGASKWKLADELIYSSDLYPSVIIVPKGFITDLASIPKIFRSFIPQNGKHRLAAIVHDYLCQQNDFDRVLADKIFLEAMKYLGVNIVKRTLMYVAVAILTVILRKQNA